MSRARSPRALAMLHQSLAPGARIALPLRPGEDAERLRDRLGGAGFDAVRRRGRTVYARRGLTLPDYLGARLRLLVCGLNPSPYSAETGVPFGRPGNRFWPAALAAGLVEKDRDPFAALARGIGFTDLVKRPTPSAGELSRDEYRRGLPRIRALAREWRPRAVCFIGLEGWRKVVDPQARAGWVAGGFEARAAYLMPSTSGRNAHASLATLVAHLHEAANPR